VIYDEGPTKWSQIYVENAEDQRDLIRAKELSQATQRNETMNSIMTRNFVRKNLAAGIGCPDRRSQAWRAFGDSQWSCRGSSPYTPKCRSPNYGEGYKGSAFLRIISSQHLPNSGVALLAPRSATRKG
jgi:hypothetical protein